MKDTKQKLSVIIISKNAENDIADAIYSIKFADEIIVIDSGSTDRTQEVAKRLGATVFNSDSNSFSERRNFGLKNAKGEWVLYIDTDERLSTELATNIKQAIENENISAYRLMRKNFYFGNHPWPSIEKMERLFKRRNLQGWQGILHESPVFKGEVSELEGLLLHYTHKDLSSMVKKTIEWSSLEAEFRFKSNHPKMTWWRFPRVMITAFYDSYIRQKGYKAGTVGIIESLYQSFSIFVTYAKLWEMQNEKNETK